MTRILFSVLFSLIFTSLFSQDYDRAAGLRLGASPGITYRQMLGSDFSAEVMLLRQNHGSVAVLLFEKHRPVLLFDEINMNLVYGAGAHIGIGFGNRWIYDPYEPEYHKVRNNRLRLGVDAYVSLEYKMDDLPLLFSLDCKPYLELFDNPYSGIHLPVMAVGARYTF